MRRRAMAGATTGFAVALAVAVLASPSEATFPGKNGPIVFAGDAGDNRGGLIVFDPTSGRRTVLTRSPRFEQDEGAPAFAPSGRRIVYEHAVGAKIHIDVIRVNGKGNRQLTKGADAFDPTVSPSGRIAFDSFRHRKSFIFVMRGNGSHVRKLVKGSTPAFSPRGGLITFDTGRELDVMRLDGSHRHTIGTGSYPSFAPDGKRILFVSGDSSGHDQLFVARTNGSHRRQITANTRANLLLADPAFSPNGKKIVFEGEDITGGEGESDDLYLINADGTGQHPITTDGASESPDWGPAPR